MFLGVYHDEYYDVYISLRHIDQLYVMTLVCIYLTDFTQGNRQSSQIDRRSCDAGLGLSEKILCSKSQEYPILGKPKIPPLPPIRIGTYHGGLSSFGSEAAKNTPTPGLELLMLIRLGCIYTDRK